MNPAELARACADAMWREDAASQGLGMELVAVAPGTATLAMTVTDQMVNGHGTCHGGFLFTLADSAFAFVCNGYDVRTVAQHCSITFVSPAKLGDRLIAQAQERQRAGRSGIYDVSVQREDGAVIAEFRGHSRTIGGPVIASD
ncbi:MAG: hydroxyphenylacetyl-CoA thioesterase PaaI [Rhizobiales bacterium]|jgi:acyl-CoA thioesterase|nr:hydroxyphenylacetyl-CoA thioesterase PaaI [Hyphomicrobiales bacterium]